MLDELLTTPFDQKLIRMYIAEAATVRLVSIIGERLVTLVEEVVV